MQVWGQVRQDPELWVASLGEGFPLCPGTEKELRKLQIGAVGDLECTPTSPTKKNRKSENPQLVGNMKVSLDPTYVSWTRNRTEKGGGGIATAVSQKYSDTAVGAGEGEKDDEYLIVRIGAFSPALNVVNSYGEQRKNKKEDVEEKWDTLKKKLEEIRMRGEFCVFAGDLNKLVGQGSLGVPGNHKEISLGGKLLRELLATGNWVLVNGLGQETVEGGPFTRIDPASGNMSCLDFFIVSKELLPFVEKLIIDKERKMTPARAVRDKKKYKLVYTDHL